jgi:hypothetical protein
MLGVSAGICRLVVVKRLPGGRHDTMVPKHVLDLKAGGAERRSTSMMDTCHIELRRGPNLAARGQRQDQAVARSGLFLIPQRKAYRKKAQELVRD